MHHLSFPGFYLCLLSSFPLHLLMLFFSIVVVITLYCISLIKLLPQPMSFTFFIDSAFCPTERKGRSERVAVQCS